MREDGGLARTLLFAQIVLTLSLNVFGSKLANLLKIPTPFLLGATVIAVILLYTASVASGRNEAPVVGAQSLFSALGSVFPMGFIVGIALGAASVILVPEAHLLIPGTFYRIWGYELVAFLFGAGLLLLLSTRTKRSIVVLTFALAYSSGSAAAALAISSSPNDPLLTIIGTLLANVVVALLLVSGLISRFWTGFERQLAEPEAETGASQHT